MGANLRVIRRKIKTVGNIWQITRAMRMVAASKLKRVQPHVESSREYLRRLSEITADVAAHVPAELHPYLQERPVANVGLLLVAGDKGLAGSHNANIFRLAEQYMAEQTVPVTLLTVGVRATDFARRRGWNDVFSVPVPSTGDSRDAVQVARTARGLFDGGHIDRLDMIYTEFMSPLRRPVRLAQLLPIVAGEATEGSTGEYIFEPPAEQLLAGLLPRTVEAQIINMMLQSVAAEHAARMTAMSAATENAAELRQNLVRDLNRARQAGVTTELLEIVGGADALAHGD
jgi:F-type H+-transporting ATPase subunit gamma